jgi:uncharacterized protein DUF3592
MFDPALFLSRLGRFVFIPLGLMLLLGTAWTIWSTETWVARAIEVKGSVIEMVRSRDRENTTYLFAPVVRFQTLEGNTVEFESGLRSNPPAYRKGQTVTVLYDPDEPRSAAIRGFLSLWLMSIILGFIGTIFTAVGTVMVVISGRAALFFEQARAEAAGLEVHSGFASPSAGSVGRK